MMDRERVIASGHHPRRHVRPARTTFIDLLATSASMIANQAKLAEDLEIWSSQEFDYVDLAGPFTRASVLMPQKRNPYSLSIIRGPAAC